MTRSSSSLINRRRLLLGFGGGAVLLGAGYAGRSFLKSEPTQVNPLADLQAAARNQRRLGFLVQDGGTYEVSLSIEQWQERLDTDQFAVLRDHATERRFSSPLDKLFEVGTYHCQGCDLPAYSSDAKYDSGTGWPSWFAPIDADAIRVKADNGLFTERTEVHCRRCGGHFGHIFRDGPEPTGLRHCLNGTALRFVAA